MKDIILFETNETKEKLKDIMPESYVLVSIDEIYKKNSNKKIIPLISEDEINVLKKMFLNANSINLVCSLEYFNRLDIIEKVISTFNIEFYAKVVLDNLESGNIQNAFSAAEPVEKNDIAQMSARVKIDSLYDKEIERALNWFFEKEGILSKSEIEESKLSRLIMYALAVLIPNQLTIDNFIPEKLYRVGIDYKYESIQFRCKHKNKYKKDDLDELNILLNIALNPNNEHMVETFERKVSDIAAPLPLNKNSLQKDCSMAFGLSPNKVMSVARELFNGIKIDGEKTSLITTVNTNSLRISAEKKAEIYEFVVKHYGTESYFNGERKVHISKDYESKEAIVPKSFEETYLPTKIANFLTKDQFKIYNYIYLRTIASQMTNTSYDDSVVIVNVAGEKFKATSNKILKYGWYEVGQLYDADLNIQSEKYELPHELYVGATMNSFKLSADKFPQDEKTPGRISMGAFFKKATKELNAEEGEITVLIDQMIDFKLVTIESEIMMIPTEKAKRIFFTLESFAPNLVNQEFILDSQKHLNDIKEGKTEKEFLIDMYLKEVALLRENLEYKEEMEESIGEWKNREAQKIASEKNQKLPIHVLGNNQLLDDYIVNNQDERVEKLGVCPDCKKGEVFEKEKGFFCNSNKCRFVIWKNVLNRFFEYYNKEVTEESIIDYIKVILSKGSVKISNLYYNEDFFTKDVEIAFNDKYKNWSFSFVRKQNNQNIIVEEEKENDNELAQESNKEEKVEAEVISNTKEENSSETNVAEIQETSTTNETNSELAYENITLNDTYAMYVYSNPEINVEEILSSNSIYKDINKIYQIKAVNSYVILLNVKKLMHFVMKSKTIKQLLSKQECDLMFGSTHIEEENLSDLLTRSKVEITKQLEKDVVERKDKY